MSVKEKSLTFALIKKATRLQVLPVMVMPVLIGAAGAFAWNGEFLLGWFLITLIGSAAMHLFSNMINDLWDYKNGTDVVAHERKDGISTNSGVLTQGKMSLQQFAFWSWSMFAIALLCGLILTWFRGPWVLFYGGVGALLAYFYVAPPIRYGYRGKGYSEISIIISFGLLPVLGSYYVQTLHFDYRVVLASLPVGILTTLVLFNHHFLHWQADQEAEKRTLVVVMGEKSALNFSRIILLLGYLSILLAVFFKALPWYALFALITIIRPLSAYRKLGEHNPSAHYLPLMATSLGTSMLTGLILTLSLVLEGFLSH